MIKACRIKAPTRSLLVAESWESGDYFAYYITSRDFTPANSHFRNRHLNLANLVYLDGHVGSVDDKKVHYTNGDEDKILLEPAGYNLN
ncbi:MAG: hypothetical protein IJJ33_06635 [Victivallales bacterium]|nr:hypothetical protein [Victivallales bacterium]